MTFSDVLCKMLWKLYGIKGDTLMKKNENKTNAKFKSVIALILATSVVVGLLSSTAIKLVTATYLMQSSKKVHTGIQPIDDAINNYIDNNVPTQASTQAPSTTKAPDTTKAPETTKAPDTTKAPETTKAPDTTKAEESTTSEKMLIQSHQSALKSYNDVLVKNKLKDHRPAFTKTTTRSLSKNFIASLWFADIEHNPAVGNYLAGEKVTVKKGEATKELCLDNIKYASTIDDTNYDTVKTAVKSSSKSVVYMGYIKAKAGGAVVHGYNKDFETGEITKLFDYKDADYDKVKEVKAVRVTVAFNDETNPVPADKNGKTTSFIASVFPVVTSEQVRAAMLKSGVTEINLTYKDCSVDMYYDSKDGDIYSLTQNIKYDVSVKDGIVTSKGTVSETNTYSDFAY